MTGLESLAKRWQAEADTVEQRYGDRTTAKLLRTLAAELTETLREEADELLTLAEAADLSGYASDTLRHRVSNGSIPNSGEPGRPRIRRGDVPTKPGTSNGTSDDEAEAAALSILNQ